MCSLEQGPEAAGLGNQQQLEEERGQALCGLDSELDLEGVGQCGGDPARPKREKSHLSLPWLHTDLRSLGNHLEHVCHIKDQDSQCGWLSAKPELYSGRYTKWRAQRRWMRHKGWPGFPRRRGFHFELPPVPSPHHTQALEGREEEKRGGGQQRGRMTALPQVCTTSGDWLSLTCPSVLGFLWQPRGSGRGWRFSFSQPAKS